MNWQSTQNPPANGTRFVAVLSGGAGAGIFFLDDDGVLYGWEGMSHGKPVGGWMQNAGYSHWAPLPDGMKLFFEERSHD